MHPNNFTLYQLIKYHIELTEAMEYTLITYKYDEGELIERFNFLNNDYKKGFYHYITKKLFKKSKKITKEINDFIATYNRHNIPKMVDDRNLHSRIKYNQKLYLAYSCSNNLIQVFLDEENIKKELEDSLVKLLETTNKHFNLFYLFNTLNLFASSKLVLMEGDSLYILDDEDKQLIRALLTSLEDEIAKKSLLKESLKFLKEDNPNEEKIYELLNKISLECIEEEKNLYQDFETFTSKLEKEIEKGHN